jgi:hypothetical protein
MEAKVATAAAMAAVAMAVREVATAVAIREDTARAKEVTVEDMAVAVLALLLQDQVLDPMRELFSSVTLGSMLRRRK